MTSNSSKMKIFVQTDRDSKVICDYLNFNQIPYAEKDFYDPAHGRHVLDDDIVQSDSTLIVLTAHVWREMCSWPTSKHQLVQFSQNNNRIWVYDNGDSLADLVPNHKFSLDIDQDIAPGTTKIFHDGQWSDRHAINTLKNIKLVSTPYPWDPYMQMPRLWQSNCDKIDCQRDFLLLMRRKKNAAHRHILSKQLANIDGLLQRGHYRYGSAKHGPTLIGVQPTQHTWCDGYPAMDLYLDSWLEIVPETHYKHVYYVTEKTVKPIATKTPFLMVSTCGYLEFLKQFGFKTFDSIIDESYDKQYQIQDRVRLMVEQLQDIIRNGSKSFYQACQPILEHNQARLMEITGRKMYDTDLFIKQHLQEDGVI